MRTARRYREVSGMLRSYGVEHLLLDANIEGLLVISSGVLTLLKKRMMRGQEGLP